MKIFKKKTNDGLTKVSYQWLKQLNHQLNKLPKTERNDLVANYYVQISDELKQGKTEYQILSAFDNVSDIADNIYQELPIAIKVRKKSDGHSHYFALTFTWFWFWVTLGIVPFALMLGCAAGGIGFFGYIFFSFAILKSYSGLAAIGTLVALIALAIFATMLCFWLTAIFQAIFYFCLRITIRSFRPNSTCQWMQRSSLGALNKKMWWKVWTLIISFLLVLTAIGAPLTLTKGGLAYNAINGIYTNNQLVMNPMKQEDFIKNYFDNMNPSHIWLNLAGGDYSNVNFVKTTDAAQPITVNGTTVEIPQNGITVVREYNTSRQYINLKFNKITKYNYKTRQDEKLLEFEGDRKTPQGVACWEDILFSFGHNDGHYIIYSPYNHEVFANDDFINQN